MRCVILNPFFWFDIWRAIWFPYPNQTESNKKLIERDYKLAQENSYLRNRLIAEGVDF